MALQKQPGVGAVGHASGHQQARHQRPERVAFAPRTALPTAKAIWNDHPPRQYGWRQVRVVLPERKQAVLRDLKAKDMALKTGETMMLELASAWWQWWHRGALLIGVTPPCEMGQASNPNIQSPCCRCYAVLYQHADTLLPGLSAVNRRCRSRSDKPGPNDGQVGAGGPDCGTQKRPRQTPRLRASRLAFFSSWLFTNPVESRLGWLRVKNPRIYSRSSVSVAVAWASVQITYTCS